MSKKYTIEFIKEEIPRIMNDLEIDHLPTNAQLMDYGIYSTSLKQFGGLKGISLLLGIPLTPNLGNTKKVSQNKKIRPSRAFEKEAKAREKGLHYADLQKEETLRIVGGIEC